MPGWQRIQGQRGPDGCCDDLDRVGALLGSTGRIFLRGNDAVHLQTNQLGRYNVIALQDNRLDKLERIQER